MKFVMEIKVMDEYFLILVKPLVLTDAILEPRRMKSSDTVLPFYKAIYQIIKAAVGRGELNVNAFATSGFGSISS